MRYLILILISVIAIGCAHDFTTTFPDGKQIVISGRMPSDQEVSYKETRGMDINEYKVSRDNRFKLVENASVISVPLSGLK